VSSNGLKNILSSPLGKRGQIQEAVLQKCDIAVFGLPSAERAVTAVVSAMSGCNVLYIAPDFVTAGVAFEQINALTGNAVLLPSVVDVLTYRRSESRESVYKRIEALYKIEGIGSSENGIVVVATAETLCNLYPMRGALSDATVSLKVGDSFALDTLARLLVTAGYKRAVKVETIGEFALRGDILDIFGINGRAVRCEFFGDTLESIRTLDIDTMVSAGAMSEVRILPCYEEVGINAQSIKLTQCGDLATQIMERVNSGDVSAYKYLLPYVREQFCSLDQFLPDDFVVFFDEKKQIEDNLRLVYSEYENRFSALLMRGEVLPDALGAIVESGKAITFDRTKIYFSSVGDISGCPTIKPVTQAMSNYTRNFAMLQDDIKEWQNAGYKVILCAGDIEGANGLKENLGIGIDIIPDFVPYGWVDTDSQVVIIGTHNLFAKSRKSGGKSGAKSAKTKLQSVPKEGDFVVHSQHGIGLCEGVKTITTSGYSRDYATIIYAGDGKIYVPIENLDSLSLYQGGEQSPTLNKLGGNDWEKTKARVKKSVSAMAFDLMGLYGERSQKKGYIYSGGEELLEEFESAFPYTETDDQLTAIAESIGDLRQGKIMDRLLCGDVGYGKTEVALRVAFRVIIEGKQAVILAPTTILARQHAETAKKRMEAFGVKVASLTRFESPANIKKVLDDLAAGKVDLVIGTHRLLSKDVKFKDLGLLILDEEQRFGVADKEKIKLLKKDINVLTLSATPIPRTLHLSLIGVRDISVLDTPPADRIPVQTFVSEYTEGLAAAAIERELSRSGKVFVVYNRVEKIESFAASIASLAPKAKVVVGHGQMTADRLERAIDSFVHGDADILVASTIIENGLDIAVANTMIVADADRLGLSQLYQLRGRVGRGNRLAYVFFTYDGRKSLTDTAYKRLEAITQFTQFGSGFKIAMRDLEIRGAGNVMGREQHGHMEKVGYDMYCRLLGEAVAELKGETPDEAFGGDEVKTVIDYSAYLPKGYVSGSEERMALYAKIARVGSIAEKDGLISEIKDIYGTPPQSAVNLVGVGLIKNLSRKMGANCVKVTKGEISLSFKDVGSLKENVFRKATKYGGRLNVERNPVINFGNQGSYESFMRFLTE